jgi:hypothetical protein
MKGRKPFLTLATGFLAFITLVGCAGSIPQDGPSALNIGQFTVSNGVIGISYKFLLIASGGVQPYTWTISAGALPTGLSLTTDGVISGTPTTLGKFTFTAKVVDSQSPTQAFTTLTTSITINPVLSMTASSLPNGLVGGPYSQTVTAANGLPPYTYSVAFGSLPAGMNLTTDTNDTSGTISGTPTSAGVFNFTIQAEDSANEVATAAFTLTVVGRLQGPYVLYFNGFDNSQPFYDVASFITDGNGKVTSGVLDQMGPGSATASAIALTGTYSVGTGTNLGTLSLTRGDNGASLNFNIIVDTLADSKVILSDPNAPNAYGSGLLKKQTLTTVSGNPANYSFGSFGTDATGNRYAGVGMFSVGTSSGGTQPMTAGEEDLNDNGTISSQVLITGGSMTQLDFNTGRGTYMVTTASGTANYVYYVVSTTELVSLGTDAAGPFTLSDLQSQQLVGASGSFSNASLTGQTVLEMDGVATSNGGPVPAAAVGVATFDGAGNIARTDGLSAYYTDESDGGVLSTVQYPSGTYSVDATCGSINQPCGRVTVSLTGAPTQPVWYLVSTNQAFALDTNAAVMAGTLQTQTVPTPNGFNLPTLLGTYLAGTITPVLPSVTNELDVAGTPPPGGLWAQNFDFSGPIGQGQSSFSGQYGCGGTPPLCSTLATAFGRYEITGPQTGTSLISILYLLGSGSPGITGSKGGMVSINVGQQSDGTPDHNPRLSNYTR